MSSSPSRIQLVIADQLREVAVVEAVDELAEHDQVVFEHDVADGVVVDFQCAGADPYVRAEVAERPGEHALFGVLPVADGQFVDRVLAELAAHGVDGAQHGAEESVVLGKLDGGNRGGLDRRCCGGHDPLPLWWNTKNGTVRCRSFCSTDLTFARFAHQACGSGWGWPLPHAGAAVSADSLA